jgi:hypothetical protein
VAAGVLSQKNLTMTAESIYAQARPALPCHASHTYSVMVEPTAASTCSPRRRISAGGAGCQTVCAVSGVDVSLLSGRLIWPVALLALASICAPACSYGKPISSPHGSAASPGAIAGPKSATHEKTTSASAPKPMPPDNSPLDVPAGEADQERETHVISSFAVEALSRGKGVPPAAREALRQVREMVEADQNRGISVSIKTTRIGLEGETRLCIEYKNPDDGARGYERAKAIVKGVDLVNLVAGPCSSSAPAEKKEKQS